MLSICTAIAPTLWLKHRTRWRGPPETLSVLSSIINVCLARTHIRYAATAPTYINQWQYDYFWMTPIHYLKQGTLAYSLSDFQIKIKSIINVEINSVLLQHAGVEYVCVLLTWNQSCRGVIIISALLTAVSSLTAPEGDNLLSILQADANSRQGGGKALFLS